MAITSSQVGTNNTLEQFRTEFNNLRDDVSGLESGTISFSGITTTSIATSSITSDSIVFEGATDDAFETTLAVSDPTADRTITLPDETGTVHTSGGNITIPDAGTLGSASSTSAITIASTGIVTFVDDILLKDAATIGNASVADVMTLASTGIVTFKDDIVIKDGGTIGTGTTAGAITIAAGGDVTLSGDLTISGDDLTMGTNTSGHILVADGTNFNPTAVGDLSEISTVANDDVLLAVDTSGGGLKKIARSTLVSGLATSAALTNIVEDTTPQLGGDLDVNSNDIVSTSNGNISLLPNGSGKVVIDGNGSSGGVSISDGIIDLRTGTGSIAKILFYCESSNAHAQTLQAAPHSEAASNTLTLPSTGGSVDLVSTASTATLTNKTLTSAVLTTARVIDDGYIQFGTDNEVRLISNPDKGLILKHTATADDKPVSLTLQTGETDIAADDIIGKLDFQAPDEGTGTDAILVAAGIEAVSEGDFSSSSNATKLVFKTAASEAASEKMSLSSAGLLTVADDIVFKDGGTIGVTSATDAMTVSSGGIVTFKDDILIKDGGTIGSTSDADAITIASNGVVTFSQNPVFPDGSVPLDDLDIDGGTDIGAALSTSDLIIVDDGAGGTNRKAALSRVVTLMTAQGFSSEDPTALAIALG